MNPQTLTDRTSSRRRGPAAPPPVSDRRVRRVSLAPVIVTALLIVFAGVLLLPLLWMVTSAGKTTEELFADPWALPQAFDLGNFVKAWEQGVFRYLGNSVIVTLGSIVLVTVVSAFAAYALTRLDIPFSQPILLLILGGFMLSPTVAVVPLFRMLSATPLYDTHLLLILLYAAFRIPFTVFLIRAYMLGLPREVEDAAMMDGASRFQLFWRIIVPMCRPILVSVALLQALFAWNEFLLAMIFLSSNDLLTLPIGLMNMQNKLTTDWPVMFAGLTIASIPMLALFLVGNRQFVRGLAEGTGK